MSDPIKQQISREERIALIQFFPCFAKFSKPQCVELADMMLEVECKSSDVIITEGELVDSVYIIVRGEMEVTHAATRGKKSFHIPIAILRAGEGIGLNDTGFYSATGKRTASVVAMTEALLLKLDIKDLYIFLKKNNLELSMYEASEQMLRMRLIKQSLPFGKISHERLQWLAQMVEEIKLSEGDILFREGEKGDRCYLIRSGQIEIVSSYGEPVAHQLAVLRPPVLFGEATMIMHAPRNATARAIKDTELLVLRHEHLSELIEKENQVASMFVTLMLDRSRPAKNENVIEHRRTAPDGQEIVILKSNNGGYFKLSEEGYYIWQHLDGNHTLQEITLGMSDKFNVFSPNMVAALISKLTSAGFISNLDIQLEHQIASQPRWVRVMVFVQRLLNKRFVFGNSDEWITKSYNKYVKYLFSKVAHLIYLLFIVGGMYAFVVHSPSVIHFFSEEKVGLFLILLLIPLGIIDYGLHELAHAYATKASGREVKYMGIGWMLTGPVVFADTSDMWLASRRDRIFVNFVGVYLDVTFAGLCALLMFVIPNIYVQGFLWLFALYTYIDAIRDLNPMQELDGYYLLMDGLETNQLRQRSVLWLVRKFPRCLRHPSLFKENRPELIYWLSCILYLIVISLITYFVQIFIFEVFGLDEGNLYITMLLPILIVIISSLGIIADIKSQANE